MKVLVCGDRDLDGAGYEEMTQRLGEFPKDTTIIEGACRGADLSARRVAEYIGLDLIEIPANWTRYGPAAGPIRNRRMLDLEPDLVLAFHPSLATSKGTKDCVEEAKRRGIPVEIITGE